MWCVERVVRLEVLGYEYPLRTDAPEEEVQEILQLVKAQVEAHAVGAKRLQPIDKMAILASVNLAGEYIRLKKDFEKYKRTVDIWVENVTKKIENTV